MNYHASVCKSERERVRECEKERERCNSCDLVRHTVPETKGVACQRRRRRIRYKLIENQFLAFYSTKHDDVRQQRVESFLDELSQLEAQISKIFLKFDDFILCGKNFKIIKSVMLYNIRKF